VYGRTFSFKLKANFSHKAAELSLWPQKIKKDDVVRRVKGKIGNSFSVFKNKKR
jgi:hypothetical protein